MDTEITLTVDDFVGEIPFKDVPYISIQDAKNKPFYFKDAVVFENKNGKGVHILVEDQNGVNLRVCTHSVPIVSFFEKPKVVDALIAGTPIRGKIINRQSMTSGRIVTALASW